MKLILIIVFYISTLGWAWGDSLAAKNRQGNKLYKEGRVDEALSKWRDAQIENPDNEKLHYNIGNGLHEQKKYEDAFNEYEKTLGSKDSELQKDVYYNMGNTHYRMGKLQEAIEDYKKCLDIDPNDEDAKYNIEFVRKKIKENLKKEEEKEQQSQQKGSKGQEQQAQSQPSKDQEKQKEQEQAEAEKQGQGEEKEEKERQAPEQKETGKEEKSGEQARQEKEGISEQSQGEEKKDQMSKEDALRLLDALKDDEKDLQKELRNQPVEGEYRVEKDW